MKRLLYILLALCLLSACSNEIPEKKPYTRSGRTVLAYFIANNAGFDLNEYLQQNVVWMYEGLASMPDSCTMLIYYRPNKGDRTLNHPVLLEYSCDGKKHINDATALEGNNLTFAQVFGEAKIIKEYASSDSYSAVDPENMKEVFRDMQAAAPSKAYGLVFGSHASGWLKGTSVKNRAFGDDLGYSIDIPELAAVLGESFTKKLDFIVFDACMMGAAEVGYELRNVTDYCVASVLETPVDGFPYDELLPYLCTEEVDYNQICKSIIDYNKSIGAWGAFAAMDCSEMENLAAAVRQELSQSTNVSTFDYRPVQQYGRRSFRNHSFDVIDFFRVLNGGNVSENLMSAVERVVVAKDCIEASRSFDLDIDAERFCGIGMYYPKVSFNSIWNNYYASSIAWCEAVGWTTLSFNQ